MDETIYSSSPVGKRLGAIKKNEKCFLVFGGKKIPLVTKITVGRDRKNDLVLDSKLVSRFHAYLQKIKNEFYVRDLHSANGTFINEKQVEGDKYYKVNPSDTLRFGNVEISLENDK